MPLGRALLLQMARKALKGDLKVAPDLLKLQERAEATRERQAAAKAARMLAAAERAARAKRDAAQERREEAKRREEEEVQLPFRYSIGDTHLDEALVALGVLTPGKRWAGTDPISHWAYRVLAAADPDRIAGLTERERLAVREHLDEDEPVPPELLVAGSSGNTKGLENHETTPKWS